jgi:hypothetical protein
MANILTKQISANEGTVEFEICFTLFAIFGINFSYF